MSDLEDTTDEETQPTKRAPKTGIQILSILVAVAGLLLIIGGGVLFALPSEVDYLGETQSCVGADFRDFGSLGSTDYLDFMDECDDADSERNTLAGGVAGVGLAVLLTGFVMVAVTYAKKT